MRIPKLPRRHFFDSYGVKDAGIAYTDNSHFWLVRDRVVVAFTSDHDVLRGWKRELCAASKAVV